MPFCENCGTKLSEKAKFCPSCGAKTLSVPEEIEPASPNEEEPIDKAENDKIKRSAVIELECKLLCWHNFFVKCHELENSFPLKDDLSTNSSVKDITVRDVTFDNSSRQYEKDVLMPIWQKSYEENVVSKTKKRVIKEKTLIDEYQKERLEAQRSCNKVVRNRIIFAFCLLMAILGLIFCILTNPVGQAWLVITGMPLLFVFGVAAVVVFKQSDMSSVDPSKKSLANGSTKYEEWAEKYLAYNESLVLNKLCATSIENYIKPMQTRYNAWVEGGKNYIEEQKAVLTSMREDIASNYPLPEKYQCEAAVDALLALVLDGRAESWKEAVNLYETEKYRSMVALSLETLNRNLITLNQNITDLRGEIAGMKETMHAGFTAMIQNTERINQKLDSIAFDTRWLAVSDFLND